MHLSSRPVLRSGIASANVLGDSRGALLGAGEASAQGGGANSFAPSFFGCILGASGALVGIRRRRSARRPQHLRLVTRRADSSNLTPASGSADEWFLDHNPATGWPRGRSRFTTQYPDEFNIKDPKGSFEKVGRTLLQEMLDELPDLYEMPAKEVAWVNRSLTYNTLGGKMNRGLIVLETGKDLLLHQGRTPNNRELHRFSVLGWAIELLQASMLMADDMMDGSLTRRGHPCWYRLPDVGLLNTNDFLMVEMMVYKTIKRHFGLEQCYPWLVDLFLETTFQTECGQLLDSICANCKLEEMTIERWTLIVKYKTAFYSFYLPVAAAMLVAGIRDPTAYDVAREALLEMGIYFQAQDDYLDAFANSEVLGKVGTDIQDKKCSWLFAHAYHDRSTPPEARALLDKHYGRCKVGSKEEESIKDLYRELGLPDLFEQYERDVVVRMADFRARIEAVQLPWSVFGRFFDMIHHRRK